jgi:DNA replicative helicase MCM subunit Mcm2 (Cdc46/Mcm family)
MDDSEFDRLMEIQRMTASSIRQESEVDNKIKVLDVLNELTATKGKKVQVEEVIIECGMVGLSEAEVMITLDTLKADGMLMFPESGYVQLT